MKNIFYCWQKKNISPRGFTGHFQCSFDSRDKISSSNPDLFHSIFEKDEKNVAFPKKIVSSDFWPERLSGVLTTLHEIFRQQTGLFPLKLRKSKTPNFFLQKTFFSSKRFSWHLDWSFDKPRKKLAMSVNTWLKIQYWWKIVVFHRKYSFPQKPSLDTQHAVLTTLVIFFTPFPKPFLSKSENDRIVFVSKETCLLRNIHWASRLFFRRPSRKVSTKLS